jgi:hypothetical protein
MIIVTANWDYGIKLDYPDSMFYPLMKDADRAVCGLGLPPLPFPKDPPAPLSEVRVKEILADPRVQAAAAREKESNK